MSVLKASFELILYFFTEQVNLILAVKFVLDCNCSGIGTVILEGYHQYKKKNGTFRENINIYIIFLLIGVMTAYDIGDFFEE